MLAIPYFFDTKSNLNYSFTLNGSILDPDVFSGNILTLSTNNTHGQGKLQTSIEHPQKIHQVLDSTLYVKY